jgi:regulator of replication initiation timing
VPDRFFSANGSKLEQLATLLTQMQGVKGQGRSTAEENDTWDSENAENHEDVYDTDTIRLRVKKQEVTADRVAEIIDNLSYDQCKDSIRLLLLPLSTCRQHQQPPQIIPVSVPRIGSSTSSDTIIEDKNLLPCYVLEIDQELARGLNRLKGGDVMMPIDTIGLGHKRCATVVSAYAAAREVLLNDPRFFKGWVRKTGIRSDS